MNVWERRRILNLLRQRVAVTPHPRRPRCGLADTISQLVSGGRVAAGAGGRSSSDCEIHIDGNLFFWVAGVAGAGLAFLTFQAITMAGRRRRRDTGEVGADTRLADLLWLGRTPICLHHTIHQGSIDNYCHSNRICVFCNSIWSLSLLVTSHRKDRTIIIVLSGI